MAGGITLIIFLFSEVYSQIHFWEISSKIKLHLHENISIGMRPPCLKLGNSAFFFLIHAVLI